MSNKSRTLVKIDDTIIEIKETKDGSLKAQRISDEDLVEVSLLEEGINKQLENDINRLTNEAYEELKKEFKNNLKTNVLQIVGFRGSWNTWEVDHCNGRQSEITNLLSSKIKDFVRQEIDKVSQAEVQQMLAPLKKVIKDEFKAYFLNEVRRSARDQAQEAAKVFLGDLLRTQVKKYQKKAIEQAELAFKGRTKNQTVNEDSE